jgi:hypothetical protein
MRIRSAATIAVACILGGAVAQSFAQEFAPMTAAQEAIVLGKWVRVNNANDRLPLQGEALAATTRCSQPMFAAGTTAESPADPGAAQEAEPQELAAEPEEVEETREPAVFDYSELAAVSPPEQAPLPRPKPVVEPDYSEEMAALFPDPEMAEGDVMFFHAADFLVLAEKDALSVNLWRIDIGVTRTEIGPQFRLEFLEGWEAGEWRKALSGDNSEILFFFQIGENPVYDFFFSQSVVVGNGTFLKCAA